MSEQEPIILHDKSGPSMCSTSSVNTTTTGPHWYYYLREYDVSAVDERDDEIKNQPVIRTFGCVCIGQWPDGTWNRGISLCSSKEKHFVRKKARHIAFGRMITAVANKQWKLHDIDTIHAICEMGSYPQHPLYSTNLWLQFVRGKREDCMYVTLCDCNVKLTPFEQRIVTKPEGK